MYFFFNIDFEMAPVNKFSQAFYLKALPDFWIKKCSITLLVNLVWEQVFLIC